MKQELTLRHAPQPGSAVRRVSGEALRIVAPLAVLAGGGLGFAALYSLKAEPASEDRTQSAPLVETVAVRPHQGELSFTVDGLVVPYREINLSAEVAGRIASKAEACRAGTFVPQGTPLLEIDARDYQLEVQRLERELAQADVTLKELDVEVKNTQSLVELAREQLTLQRKELERMRALLGEKVIADAAFERTKREELNAVNAVMSLENQSQLLNTRRNRLESARDLWQTQLEKANLDLSRTRIVAPIDGVVVEEMVEEDTFVQKGASLLKLEDTSAVEVRCNLRMDQLLWLWSQEGDAAAAASALGPKRDYQIPNAPVTVSYDLAGRRYVWEGVLSRFDGIGVDERTRTVPCRALVAQPRQVRVEMANGQPAPAPHGPPALVRGMYVTVRVATRQSSSLLEIPERAVRPGNQVWAVVDGRLEIKRVRVAHVDKDRVLVHADDGQLEPGSRVVSSPLAVAEDGMLVEERVIE